jgi:adenylate kinase
MRLILLGPPGAGKGTQAKQLARKLDLAHISTGDILRENVAQGSDLGKRAKDFMNKGELVPDALVNQMLIERLKKPDTKKGFILDGYPRNLNQAKSLDEILKSMMMPIDLAIDLDSSEPVIIQRLSGRLVCRRCGANFHRTNMPPKKEGVCDNCGGQLYQRADDKAETIKNRLQVYRQEAAVLMKYYEQNDKLKRLSADEDAQVVLDKIIDLVKNYNDSLKV